MNPDSRFSGKFNFGHKTVDMFTVAQRVHLIHFVINIFNICSWFSRQTDETRLSFSVYFKCLAILKRINKGSGGQKILFYVHEIFQCGYIVAISEAHEKQRKKNLRTVHFNTSTHVLKLIRHLWKLQETRRHKCIILAATVNWRLKAKRTTTMQTPS